MTTFPAPDCVWDQKAELGEGVVWSAAEQAVYWVDIPGRCLHRYAPSTGARRSWDAPARTCFAVPVAGGGLLCGHEDGLRTFSPENGTFGPLHPIEPLLHDNRLNDGAVDGAGRLWFGTMHDPEEEATGSLYRLEGLGDVAAPQLMDGGYTVTNGPAFDQVRHRLYHTDSAARRIYAFDLVPDGTLRNKRLFAEPDHGHPDGMTVDAEGTLWVALWGGGGVQRYRPDGSRDGFVALPCEQVTRIAFGDADLRTAYVSTARKGLDQDSLRRQPLAGGLFRFRVEVPGLPQDLFRP